MVSVFSEHILFVCSCSSSPPEIFLRVSALLRLLSSLGKRLLGAADRSSLITLGPPWSPRENVSSRSGYRCLCDTPALRWGDGVLRGDIRGLRKQLWEQLHLFYRWKWLRCQKGPHQGESEPPEGDSQGGPGSGVSEARPVTRVGFTRGQALPVH